MAVDECRRKLEPSPAVDVLRQLTPVLALIGASGLSADDREEWLAAATEAVCEIPGELLTAALRAARRTVDHPSKLVPFVFNHVESWWATRRKSLRMAQEHEYRLKNPPVLQIPDRDGHLCTAEQAAEILAEHGIRTKQPASAKPLPTVDDYIALGLNLDEAKAMVAKQARERAADKTVTSSIAA